MVLLGSLWRSPSWSSRFPPPPISVSSVIKVERYEKGWPFLHEPYSHRRSPGISCQKSSAVLCRQVNGMFVGIAVADMGLAGLNFLGQLDFKPHRFIDFVNQNCRLLPILGQIRKERDSTQHLNSKHSIRWIQHHLADGLQHLHLGSLSSSNCLTTLSHCSRVKGIKTQTRSIPLLRRNQKAFVRGSTRVEASAQHSWDVQPTITHGIHVNQPHGSTPRVIHQYFTNIPTSENLEEPTRSASVQAEIRNVQRTASQPLANSVFHRRPLYHLHRTETDNFSVPSRNPTSDVLSSGYRSGILHPDLDPR